MRFIAHERATDLVATAQSTANRAASFCVERDFQGDLLGSGSANPDIQQWAGRAVTTLRGYFFLAGFFLVAAFFVADFLVAVATGAFLELAFLVAAFLAGAALAFFLPPNVVSQPSAYA